MSTTDDKYAMTKMPAEAFVTLNPRLFGHMGAPFGVAKEHYKSADRKICAALVLDNCDEDWTVILVGRDQNGEYRCFDIKVSIPTVEQARAAMLDRVKENWRDDGVFRQ